MRGRSWSWIRNGMVAVVLGATLAAPAGAATPDAWITTKVKLALLTTEGVSGTDIKVDTVLGRVTLYGKAYSAEEKAKAESVARGGRRRGRRAQPSDGCPRAREGDTAV